MRRILAGFGMMVGFVGAAALTPFFAALGAGVTLTVIALGLSIWRWFTRRARAGAGDPASARGVR
mgnify:CR=1 FL=1